MDPIVLTQVDVFIIQRILKAEELKTKEKNPSPNGTRCVDCGAELTLTNTVYGFGLFCVACQGCK